MAELRRKLEEQEYNKMIANVKPAANNSLFSDEDYSTDEAKMVKNQISAIINILFSMVSVFLAIFIWMKNSPDYLVPPQS
jgi:Endoplasmic reticulum-based factor for assembly of V-ATPase